MDSAALVLDVGSCNIKAGLGNQQAPKVYRHLIGRMKHSPTIPQQSSIPGVLSDGVTLASSDALQHRGLCTLSYPMSHGVLQDNGSGTTAVLHHITASLGVDPKEHSMVWAEPVFTSRPQRYRLAQIAFERLQVPELMFANQGILSLYASGRTTGLVLDCGDGVTQAVAAYEGYTLRGAARRADLGGRDVTVALQAALRQSGHSFETSAEFDIVKDIKDQRAQLLQQSAGSGGGGVKPADLRARHVLPDGSDLTLGAELSQCAEVLFNPALGYKECSSVVHVASDCIRLADVDLRRQLYESVLLVGGCTMMQGFSARFLMDLTKLTPKDCKVRVTAPAERSVMSWMGATFLAELSTFKDLVVRRGDYLEQGESVLHAKVVF